MSKPTTPSSFKKPFTQSFEELPNTLPIFPLPNAVMLPNGELPLNIFEPRYLNMVHDSMKSHQLIGMIQPAFDTGSQNLGNDLCKVGCAGRIVRYEETSDGRLSILLAALCRFETKQELSSTRGYRLITPDWSNFAHDYNQAEPDNTQVKLLLHSALRQYFKLHQIEVNWDVLTSLSLKGLMTSLFNYLPLPSEDKQLLLETSGVAEQLTVFTAILQDSSNTSATRH